MPCSSSDVREPLDGAAGSVWARVGDAGPASAGGGDAGLSEGDVAVMTGALPGSWRSRTGVNADGGTGGSLRAGVRRLCDAPCAAAESSDERVLDARPAPPTSARRASLSAQYGVGMIDASMERRFENRPNRPPPPPPVRPPASSSRDADWDRDRGRRELWSQRETRSETSLERRSRACGDPRAGASSGAGAGREGSTRGTRSGLKLSCGAETTRRPRTSSPFALGRLACARGSGGANEGSVGTLADAVGKISPNAPVGAAYASDPEGNEGSGSPLLSPASARCLASHASLNFFASVSSLSETGVEPCTTTANIRSSSFSCSLSGIHSPFASLYRFLDDIGVRPRARIAARRVSAFEKELGKAEGLGPAGTGTAGMRTFGLRGFPT